MLQNGHLATSSEDKTVKIWNASTGSLIKILTGFSNPVWSLSVLPNGNLACSSSSQIQIWYTDTSTLVLKISNGTNGKMSAFQNDYIASGDLTGSIKIWNANNGNLFRTLNGHTSYINSFATLKNGYLASGSYDSTIKIWNVSQASLIRTIAGQINGVILVLPNGYLASGSWDYSIKIWNTDDGSLVRVPM